jgi:hypothetical protein
LGLNCGFHQSIDSLGLLRCVSPPQVVAGSANLGFELL